MWGRLVRSISSVSAHTYDTFPDDDDIALTAHGSADTEGDFVEIVSSIGASDAWFVGYYVSNPSAQLDGKVTFGTGTSGSETARAVFPFHRTLVTAVSLDETAGKIIIGAYYTIPFPLFLPSGSREAGRLKSGNAAADTINVVEHHALTLGA